MSVSSRLGSVAARLAVAALTVAAPVVLNAPSASAVPGGDSTVFINEFHYDNDGTDAGEFVEVAGPAGTDLTGWSIVLYNGNGGTAYDTDALSGTLSNDRDGYGTTVITYPANGLQNGAPDGIALVNSSNAVVQFLSYEGSFTAADGPAAGSVSTDVGVEQSSGTPLGSSLHLTGTGTTSSDFTWSSTASASPGVPNTDQAFGDGGGTAGPVINEFSASTTGTDVEYVEIFGTPDTDYSDYAILEIEGDSGSDTGAVDEVVSVGTTGANGLWLANLSANTLENGTITLLLVEGFTGAFGADLDADNDGVLDATPWATIVDAVAVNDGGAGDLTYGSPVLGVSYDGAPFAPGGASRIPDGTDTDTAADWVRNDFDLAGIPGFTGTPELGEALNTPGAPNAIVEKAPAVEYTIAEIQGTGPASTLAGKDVITTGVVTAVYPTGGFDGVYIQTPGTGGSPKVPGEDASDGIFVYSDWAAENFTAGACVEVEGTVTEYFGLTEITDAWVDAATGCDQVQATPLATLPATDAEKEVYEGMLVHPQGTYTITNNYQLNQYGQLGLAVGDEPLYQATDMVEPGPGALAYEAENRLKYITLDDGSSWDFIRNDSAKESPLPYLSHETPMRTASQVTFDQPVILDYRFQWNYQPTGHVVGADDPDIPVDSENDRPATAPEVGGNLTIGAFNVLNYFDDLGEDEDDCDYYADRDGNPVATDYCEVRGAYSEAAFLDQQAKLVAAINKSDADILGLMEIENSAGVSYLPGQPRDKALATLVEALNEAAGETRWAYVPSPVVTPTNEDIIRTAYIFNPKTVQTLGASQILLDDAFADARYPLAQKFKATKTGKPFVMIANHFKSKGSGEDDGTGQGNANPSREAQAAALTEWADEMFEDEAVFLVGDFNAYSKETPIQIIEAAGYTNLAKEAEPMSATYQYQGRLGSLDHIFANAQAERLVTGAAVWDINADESIAFQYSRRNYNIVDFFAPDEYASSDHDPVLVGLDTGSRGKGKAKSRR